MTNAMAFMAAAPMRTVRPRMLRGVYANPEKELVRLAGTGRLTRIARGTYVVRPDRLQPGDFWQPGTEAAAMAYATAAFGERVPVLCGISAARFWHAIPRAIGVATVAAPTAHQPVALNRGRIVFARRDTDALDVTEGHTELGTIRVTTPEQTLIDLVADPGQGDMPQEVPGAIRALAYMVDPGRIERMLGQVDGTTAQKVREALR